MWLGALSGIELIQRRGRYRLHNIDELADPVKQLRKLTDNPYMRPYKEIIELQDQLRLYIEQNQLLKI